MSFRITTAATLLLAATAAAAAPAGAGKVARPRITGISHYAVYSSDPAKTEAYYVGDLHATKAPDPENGAGVRFHFNGRQFVESLPLPPGQTSINRLDHVALETDDAERMRRYLKQEGVAVPAALSMASDGSRRFLITDPEGNRVEFVQPSAATPGLARKAIGTHIIHVGYLVHDAVAQNRLYRDILGFRPYWHGGSKPEFTDWIAQQVPDGTDWIEYMMVRGSEKTGIPADMKIEALGTMDHIAIGVPRMQDAVAELVGGDRIGGARATSTARPGRSMSLGLDGKWQYNLFDPDGVRSELMEFGPAVKPCCSDFAGPHPRPEG